MKAAQKTAFGSFHLFSSVLLSREGKGEVMSEKQVFKTTWGGRPLQIEVGQLAKQANGAVLVRYGDTVVLSAAVASKEAKIQTFSH